MTDSLAQKLAARFSLKTKLAFFLGLIALLAYVNTFKNGYALDDYAAIVKNSIVTKGVSAIPQIFCTPYLRGYIINPNDLYRPLSLAMFAIEYQVFSGSPAAGHVINVIFFAGCVILLFIFLDALFLNKKIAVAFLASLFFALHPIHTEVVANIKSRDELLCFFFAFLSLNLFIKYSSSGNIVLVITGAFCYFLSLLSKETSITFLFIVPLIFLFFRNENKKRSLFIFASVIVVLIIFLFLRFSVLNAYHANHPFQIGITENSLAAAPSIATRLSTAIFILGYYIKQLVFPYPLICDYSYNSIPLVTFTNIKVLLSLAVYLFLLCFGTFGLFKGKKNLFAFAVLFFLLTLSLFSNLFFLVGATMAERFMFFPSVGFCLLLALVIEKWVATGSATSIHFLKTPTVLMITIPLSLLYAFITFSRNTDWVDSYTLYKTDIKHAPNDYRLFYYLGTDLINAGTSGEKDTATGKKILEEGLGYLKKSVAIYPNIAVIYAEIGSAYLYLAQYDSAELYDNLAIKLDPKDTFSMNKLAGIYFKREKYGASIVLCKKGIAIDSAYARGYRNMAACYLKMGKYDSAVYVLKVAIRLDPSASSPYGFLAIAYNRLGNPDSARKYEAIAQQDNPGFRLQ